jgi:hypothetical protein
MSIDILWDTVLNPRNRQMRHLSSSEFEIAKKKFIDEAMKLTVLSTSQQISFDERNVGNDIDLIFQETNPDAVTTANGDLHHSSVMREVENYLDSQLYIHFRDDPLVRWKDHMFQFPRIAVAARKWLGVPGTSTSSERVFSHCGVALTAKRAAMRGDALMNQVLLKSNLKHLNLSMEDIEKALL